MQALSPRCEHGDRPEQGVTGVEQRLEREAVPLRRAPGVRDVWGFRSLGRTRTLDSHASRLRRQLNPDGEPTYVVNVRGVGYRLVAPAA